MTWQLVTTYIGKNNNMKAHKIVFKYLPMYYIKHVINIIPKSLQNSPSSRAVGSKIGIKSRIQYLLWRWNLHYFSTTNDPHEINRTGFIAMQYVNILCRWYTRETSMTLGMKARQVPCRVVENYTITFIIIPEWALFYAVIVLSLTHTTAQ